MNSIWLWVLAGSIIVLALMLIRSKSSSRWFSMIVLNVVIASVVFYLMHGLDVPDMFRVPINYATLGIVILLGLPGLAMMVGVKALFVS